MTEKQETAAEKKKREAQEAAAAKAKKEKEAAAAEKEKEEAAAAERAQKEAEKNDEEPSNKPTISTTHDEVMKEKLAHASTKKARQAEAENYRKQQERQAALERDTQRGLGFDGVREDGKK
jgi:hypothetical protein